MELPGDKGPFQQHIDIDGNGIPGMESLDQDKANNLCDKTYP